MIKQAIKKIISLVLVSSLLIGNIFTYVEARDLKLSIIYMLDAIEDMEYKERESVYESEHLSFLSHDEEESNNESSNVEGTTVNESDENENEEETINSNEYEEEPEDNTESEEQENFNEGENLDTSSKEEQEPNGFTVLNNSMIDDEEPNNIATKSETNEDDDSNSDDNEEPEDDTIETESTTFSSAEETTSEVVTTINENLSVATNSDIVDAEETENKSTPSEIEEDIVTELVEELAVATESIISKLKYDPELEHIATESDVIIATSSEISDELRAPEKYYRDYKTYDDKLVESGAVLTGYDKYSRTYLIEENVGTDNKGQTLNKYVKIISPSNNNVDKDGKIKINNDNLVKKVEEVKTQEFKIFGGLFGSNLYNDESDIVNDTIYTNTEGKSKVEVSSNGNNGYSIKSGDYSIRVIPITGDYTKSKVLDNAIRYSNVFNNIDVQYTILGGDVKEDIILLDKTDINSFSYKLELNGLSAKREDESIKIYNDDERAVFTLTAPAMIDSENKISDKIEIKYNEIDSTITYVVDTEFLSNAMYPVRIDPIASTIEEDDGYVGMEMHAVRSNRANEHYDNLEYKKFGNFEGSVIRQMVWVDPEVFIGPGITNSLQVELALNTVGCFTNGEVEFRVGKVNEIWDKDSVTWNTKPNNISYINNGSYSSGVGEEMTFDITQFFREWITNPNPTPTVDEEGNTDFSYIRDQVKGLVLSLSNESSNNKYETFMTGNLSPRIQVTYTSPSLNTDLYEKHISESEFHIGAATKKSSKGGQTFEGVVAYGLMQTGDHGPSCEHDGNSCTHMSRHKVEFTVYEKRDSGIDSAVWTETINAPDASISYPNYKLVNNLCTDIKARNSNVQSNAIRLGDIELNKIYYIKAKASGCERWEHRYVEVEVPDDYAGPPIPPLFYSEHKGRQVYNTDTGRSSGEVPIIEDSTFLLYKVKLGDTLDKIAGHYGVTIASIQRENHFNSIMCYEDDILFIRNPQTIDEMSVELFSEVKELIKEFLMLLGNDEILTKFELEPVNMSTGDFYLEHTDISVPELGGETFKISRSYNSISRGLKSDFGYGFNSIINDRLMVSSDGTAMHFDSTGGGDVYKKSSNGYYKGQKGDSILIPIVSIDGIDGDIEDEEDDDSSTEETFDNFVSGSDYWQIKYKDGRLYTYNSSGSIRSIEDSRGLKYTYNYDSKYRVSSILTPSGMTFTFTYNSDDLITRVTLPDGNSISYEYDSNKNLIKATDAENRVTRYEYDSDHKMTSWYDSDNIRQVLNTYDSSGRVIKQLDANGNEATITYYSDRTVMTDNEGIEHEYLLDTKKRTKSELFGSSMNYDKEFNFNGQLQTVTDENGTTATYTYNSNGNLIKEERTDGDFTISRSWVYDDNGNILSETDYNGNTTTYTYDARNNLTKITDPNGNTEEMTYDSLSRMTSKKDKNGNITRWTYSGNNPLPETETKANGSVTRYTYDGMRRKTSETDAEGYTTQITYDRTGRKLKEIDKRGNETNYTYSSRGTVTKINDRENNETTFTYDNVGNI